MFFPLLCWVGVHCGIYKGSYNVSNRSHLNSSPPPLSFVLLSPASWNTFSRCHFWIYIHHVYTFFALYSLSYLLSLSPCSLPLVPPTLGRTCSVLLFKIKVATQGVSLWYFCVYMYYNHLVYLLLFSSFHLSSFLKIWNLKLYRKK
jgi:hypothetical protein